MALRALEKALQAISKVVQEAEARRKRQKAAGGVAKGGTDGPQVVVVDSGKRVTFKASAKGERLIKVSTQKQVGVHPQLPAGAPVFISRLVLSLKCTHCQSGSHLLSAADAAATDADATAGAGASGNPHAP